jgi:serine O-acetyltransferase
MPIDRDEVAWFASFVARQLDNFFPDSAKPMCLDSGSIQLALNRTRRCLAQVKGTGEFNHLVSGHYATFLYYLSHVLGFQSDKTTATKLFLLNKALNGIDLFYEIAMPEVFLIGHTVGMVFAKASYSDYCVFHQGCTVGRSGDNRPELRGGLIMYPNSSVIGHCKVEGNTVLTPGVQLINRDSPGNCLVFSGKSGRPVFKEAKEDYLARYFHRPLTEISLPTVSGE